MRCLGLLFLFVSTLPAQFFDFAVTDDGRLYFSTPLQIAGVKDIQSKVYRWTDAGPELFATPGSGENPFGDSASSPLVSGNGAITGWMLTRGCGPSCGLSG